MRFPVVQSSVALSLLQIKNDLNFDELTIWNRKPIIFKKLMRAAGRTIKSGG